MASIATEPNGRRRILVEMPNGKRATIRIGELSMRDAKTVQVHVERLQAARLNNTTPPIDTMNWLAGIGDKLHGRLARARLCDARARAAEAVAITLAGLFDKYIALRTDIRPNTRNTLKQAKRLAVSYFGADRDPRAISVADAKDCRRAVRAHPYAEATTAKMVKVCRMIWADAIERAWIPSNPWLKVQPGSMSNPARLRFIERETIDKAIETAPDIQWKLLIALARYGGLRMPSEPLGLTWDDIHWDEGKMLVRSPKTERHADKATRWVPIFPELRKLLLVAFEQAEPGEPSIITRYRDASANLRTQFQRILKRAGVTPWPKLFHNLRASRETELMESFPLHVVCAWIGNDVKTAAKHYLQVRDKHFVEAAGPIEKVAQNPAHQRAPSGTNAHHLAPISVPNSQEMHYSSENRAIQVPLVGLEQTEDFRGNRRGSGGSGAESGALSDDERLERAFAVIRAQVAKMEERAGGAS